uniref:KH_dom_type_1 domain-containing protein n=1 Tax=Trichuris muris TaxID=70415 RepID=A0A5S6Q310_TRIMR
METAVLFTDSDSCESIEETYQRDEANSVAVLMQSLLDQKVEAHLLSHDQQIGLYDTLTQVMEAHGHKLSDQMLRQAVRMHKYLLHLGFADGKIERSLARYHRNSSEPEHANENGQFGPEGDSEQGHVDFGWLKSVHRLHVDPAKTVAIGHVLNETVKDSLSESEMRSSDVDGSNTLGEKGQTQPSAQVALNMKEGQVESARGPERRLAAPKQPSPNCRSVHEMLYSIIKYLEDGAYRSVFKKSMLLPSEQCGLLMGKKGSTLRLIEEITNSIFTFGHWDKEIEPWCFVTVTADSEQRLNGAVAMIKFLIKYQISLKYEEIVVICYPDSHNGSSAPEDNVASNEQTDLAKGANGDSSSSAEEDRAPFAKHRDSSEYRENTASLPKESMIKDKSVCDEREEGELDTTCSVTLSEADTNGGSDYEGTRSTESCFRVCIPQEEECRFEEAITVSSKVFHQFTDRNGNVGKIVQHFSRTLFIFLTTPASEDQRTIVVKAAEKTSIACAKEFVDLLTRYEVDVGKLCDPELYDEQIIDGKAEKMARKKLGYYEQLIPTNLAWLVPSSTFNSQRSSPARMLKISPENVSLDYGIPPVLQAELTLIDGYMRSSTGLRSAALVERYRKIIAKWNHLASNFREQSATTSRSFSSSSSSGNVPNGGRPSANSKSAIAKQKLIKFFTALDAIAATQPLHGTKKNLCACLDLSRNRQ